MKKYTTTVITDTYEITAQAHAHSLAEALKEFPQDAFVTSTRFFSSEEATMGEGTESIPYVQVFAKVEKHVLEPRGAETRKRVAE